MKKSLLLLSCVAFMLSCGGNENAKSDSAADKKKTEKKEKKSDDAGQTETVETTEPELPVVNDTVAITKILDEVTKSLNEWGSKYEPPLSAEYSLVKSKADSVVDSIKDATGAEWDDDWYVLGDTWFDPTSDPNVVEYKIINYERFLSGEDKRVEVTVEFNDPEYRGHLSTKTVVFVPENGEWVIDNIGGHKENLEMFVEENAMVFAPVQPQPVRSVPIEIDKEIRIIDEDWEEEESNLVAPEDMGALDDFVDVDYAEVIELEEEDEIFMAVEQQASFPGGIQKMYEFVSDNLKYPAVSRNNNSQGTTVLRFVVQEDGRIVNIDVIKSSGDVFLDNEAVRVVSSMPKWTPAKQNGRNVSSWFTYPIKFTLQ